MVQTRKVIWIGVTGTLVAAALLVFTFMALIFSNPGWDNCADEVNGQLVEYKCSEGAPKR